MSNASARVKLMGNMQAAMAEMVDGIIKECGRGFASDQEAWAEIAAMAKIAVELTEE